MNCILINATDPSTALTNVTLTHQWTRPGFDAPYVNSTGLLPVLNGGESVSMAIDVGAGGSDDLWSISFTDSFGTVFTRTEKHCNVEQEDIDSHQPVKVTINGYVTSDVLGPEENLTFSILTPVSSPCTDNSVSQQ